MVEGSSGAVQVMLEPPLLYFQCVNWKRELSDKMYQSPSGERHEISELVCNSEDGSSAKDAPRNVRERSIL